MPVIRFATSAGEGWVDLGDEAYGKPLSLVDADGRIVGSAEFTEGREKRKPEPKPPAERPASTKPGDVLKWIIERRLGRSLNCAECREWRGWMNGEGWIRCTTVHRVAILERIQQQAEEHGIDYDGVIAELWKWATERSGKKDE